MFYPCYGLAEATLLVTAANRGKEPKVRLVTPEIAERSKLYHEGKKVSQSLPIIGCGRRLPEVELIIVDPELRVPCECNTVGEIWVRGPNVAKGYYNRPEVTAEIFHARETSGKNPQQKSYLRTGDMGFLDEDGELFVLGRLKDRITLSGRSVFPQDIEWTVQSLPIGARTGCAAAFSVKSEASKIGSTNDETNTPSSASSTSTSASYSSSPTSFSSSSTATPLTSLAGRKPDEQVVVMVELKGSHTEDTLKAVEQKIRDAVREDHGIDLHDVILLPERTIPKTTSGKVMRFACRYNYLNSSFPILSPPVADAATNANNNNNKKVELTEDPTVIVGMSCRLPKADNMEEFWSNLKEGVDCISRVPDDRWNADAFYDVDQDKPGKMPTDQGGFINNVEQFDALFFSISGREAEVMDPQQRIMLEVTYEALEDAGITMDHIKGTHTGVFMGSCFSDYHKIQCTDIEKIRPYVQTGSAQSVLANRISYVFDLKGPSFSVDTACSSSLVALHLADQSLKSGDCTAAIVGGCSVNLLPEMFVAFAKLHMLSPDGRCKSFDADGNGYVRSEGVVALVLKSMSQAIKDNDPIYAVLRGTGINQDGHTPGLTFPGQQAQEELLSQVYTKAGLSASDIHYIEAHGTGTRVGDPVEVKAIGNILGKTRQEQDDPLYIGSVKSNLGHTEGASGLVGILKVVLAIEHDQLPANLHFKTPNPDIPFEDLRLSVVSQPRPWLAGPKLRRAGVNSFGFGGTNAHAVIEEYPQQKQRPQTTNNQEEEGTAALCYPFVLSAHTKKAVEELSSKLQEQLKKDNSISLKDLSYTLTTRRTHHAHRITAVASSVKELLEELKNAKPVKPKREQQSGLRVGFIFTGQGAQWYAMGRQLMQAEPVFRQSIEQCDAVLKRHDLGWSLLEELAKDEATSRVHEPDISQPACCALQIALVDLWRSWGVVPVAVLGHSSGEHGAVYASGALNLEQAILAAAYRGIVMQQSDETGKMAAVGMSEQEALELISDYAGRVGIAAINSPTSITLSGDGDAIEEIERTLKAKDVFCRVLQVKRAFHSHHMTKVAPKLLELLRDIKPQVGHTPMVSSVLGQVCKGPEFDGQYWVNNMVGTVRFLQAVTLAVETQDIHAFIELGPHPALQGPARQCLAVLGVAAEKPVLPSLARNANEHHRMLTTVCNLFALGADLNFASLLSKSNGHCSVLRKLPSYPWQHQKFWHESEISIRNRFRETSHELLGHRLPHTREGTSAWENELSLANLGFLRDHVVQGNVVFPAAGYCALGIAVAAAAASSGSSEEVTSVLLQEMTFKRPIMFDPPEAPVQTQVVLNSNGGIKESNKSGFTILVQDSKQWVEISTGSLVLSPEKKSAEEIVIADIQARCTSTTITKTEIYNLFLEAGLEYGPFFQGIQSLARGDKEAIGEVIPPACAQSTNYLLHPTLLDACFQCLLGAVSNLNGSYLPTLIKSLRVASPCHEASYWVHAVAREVNDRVLSGDIMIYSKSGALLAKVEALQCNSIGKKAIAGQDTIPWTESAYETVWRPDISTLTPATVRSVVENCPTPLDREADRLTIAYLQQSLKKIQATGATLDEKHRKLYDWSIEYLKGFKEEIPVFEPSPDNIESTIIHRLGERLYDIFTGACDALSVVFADSLLHTIYEKGQTFVAANGVVKQVVALLKHKNTGLRVLEIGAGTGGTTTHILPILGKHFESYTYTDISPSFFENAKTKFEPWVEKMKFSVLNIERDPTAQNFEGEGYDLIIATDVLHATKNMRDTLRHVRQLMAPGGSLVLNELTNTPIWVQTLFGTLSGWWLFEDPELRILGPTISAQGWEKLLYEANFDLVLAVPDREEQIHTIFSASRFPIPQPTSGNPWTILTTSASQKSELAASLEKQLEQSKAISEGEESGKNVVYLLELEQQAFFQGPKENTLSSIKSVIKTAEQVIWVVKGGLKECSTPEQAPLAGFVRSILNEYPSLRCLTVDVGVDTTIEEVAQSILAVVKQVGVETEVAYRKTQGAVIAHVARLASKETETVNATLGERSLSEIPVVLEVGTPGLLSTLRWREVKNVAALGPNEVEISVRATGLNFKDIMLSMGMLGEEAVVGGFCTNNLGIECSGVITSIGSALEGQYKVGDRVVAVAKNCFSSKVRTISSLAVHLPDHISFEEAATIPATFLTASYALNYLARMAEGETALIHAAAGGVGIAAIQLCKLAGVEVFATVGTEDKRKYLREDLGVPDDHIMSSRNLDFVEQIMEKTKGRGVDMILNSLAGEALKKSVSVLAPFGRFLEIGKRDIYGNSKLDMIHFGQNVSFFAIDLDRLNGQKPQLGGKLFRELITMFDRKLLKPLPVTTYSYANVEQAFRFMQQGKHIGKVVLTLDEGVKADVVPSAVLFRSDRSYICVGGLGGFGRAVSKWMAEKGAGHLVFVSRSGASTPEAKELVASLEASGTSILLVSGDVANEEFINQVVTKAREKAPIGGIMQAAMVLEDALIDGLTIEGLNKVLTPKVKGTYLLHKATLNDPTLEFFISFSSVSSVVGNLSQSNYAAANAYLDALAHWRTAHGLPATSINWGAIGDVGYVATRKDLQLNMEKRGIRTLPITEALAALAYAVTHPFSPQFVAAPMIWNVAAKTLTALTLSKFGFVRREDEERNQQSQGSSATKSNKGGSQLAQKLAAASTLEEKTAVVLEAIREKLASMLNVAQDSVEGDNRMSDLGVDSLMAVEMKNWIAADLKATNISVLDLTGGRSIAEIAEKIAKDLTSSSSSSGSSGGPNASGATSPESVLSPRGQLTTTQTGLLVNLSSPLGARYRVICFPHLGGNSSSFGQWPSILPNAEIWVYEPTSSINQWNDLVAALIEETPILGGPEDHLPLYFYGHSLGGLIAYETCFALETRKGKKVQRLVLGGCGSPHFPNDLVKLGAEWSDSLVESVSADQLMSVLLAGGLIDNTFAPEVIRASILLGRRYLNWSKTASSSSARLVNASIDAIVGSLDTIVGDHARVADWKNFSLNAATSTVHTIPEGHHLFILHDPATYSPLILSILDSNTN
jgi:acyl transferase domain-containing protein/NADPH:quinone reductase-like Zn-dependent oxidoreductase/surfactin synthase thioesterase subunit/NAD(P)-dependent dehydrogenase (short-subunit alcohol dehydrogenase family)/ubiquinone/menaquinone biosynthesis C-methylase UbiE